ncbi:MAG: hypothetical protein ACE5NC_06920 [Anaerolineae bacterium]
MSETPEERLLPVEVLTDTHHIFGRVPAAPLRLSDILNSEPEQILVLKEAFIYPIDDPRISVVERPFAMVTKAQIALAIPRGSPEEAAILEERRRLDRIEKKPRPVTVSIPPFAVRGLMWMVPGVDEEAYFSRISRPFIPITDGRAVYMQDASRLWEGEVILVNIRRSQVFWRETARPAPRRSRA